MGALVLAAIGFAAFYGFSRASQPPEQPIQFPHNFHVQGVGLECVFCHRTAATEAAAGIPAVQQCMFCHQVAGHRSPEVQKLLQAASNGEPIDWIRVNRVPDHTRFFHAPHVQAGVACATCHGEVQTMTVARQVRALKMGDCVNCHRQNSAPTDCSTCHY
ncbi:MAG: cytochrome c3 family protein [Chloroflexi bacterium]|nr:cytochrome c3 family protein [Chloroflexota bacterium]